jgi:hypothetical protein
VPVAKLPDTILVALINSAFLVLAACVNANTMRRRPIRPDPIPHAPPPGAVAPSSTVPRLGVQEWDARHRVCSREIASSA